MKTIEVLSKPPGFNKCRGGSFTHWQRGTSFVGVSAGVVTADRWKNEDNLGTAVFDITRQTDAPTRETLYSLRYDVTTAQGSISSSDYLFLDHRVEGHVANPLFNKSVIVSFWVKSNKLGTYCVAIRNNGNDRCYVREYTINAADTWEQKAVEIPLEYTGTWDITTGIGIRLNFVLVSGTLYQAAPDTWHTSNIIATSNQLNFVDSTSNYIQFAQVMVHEGRGLADGYHYAGGDFDSELLLCKRYYETGRVQTEAYATAGINGSELVFYKAAKRAVPTLGFTHVTGGNVSGSPFNLGPHNTVESFLVAEVVSSSAGYYYVVDWTSDSEL